MMTIKVGGKVTKRMGLESRLQNNIKGAAILVGPLLRNIVETYTEP